MTKRQEEILQNLIARIRRAQIEDTFEACILDLAVDSSTVLEGRPAELRTDKETQCLIIRATR